MNQMFVPHDLQRSASALANIRSTTASIIGPALGGFAAVELGPGSVYLANLVTFTFSLSAVLASRDGRDRAREGDVAALRSGLRYVMSRPDIVGTYIIDLLAMILAFPVVMLPFVAASFHETYALPLLYCGHPGRRPDRDTDVTAGPDSVHRYGRAIVCRRRALGARHRPLRDSSTLWLVLVGLAVAGGADAISGIFRNTMWNESIPPEMRGRMAGIEMISYSLGPTAGQFRAGVMAAWTTVCGSP
jgi:hypothetical protein